MKYLKLFEDWDKNEEFKILRDDPIMSIVIGDDPNYYYADDYDVCKAIACYVHDYNEDEPYIHYLKHILDKVGFKPSPLFSYKLDDENGEDDNAKMFYDILVKTDVYKKILLSEERYEIINYLKNTDNYFYSVLNNKINSTDLSNSAGMGDMGY